MAAPRDYAAAKFRSGEWKKTHFQTFLKAAFKLLFQIHILIMALILYPDCVEMESNDRTAA